MLTKLDYLTRIAELPRTGGIGAAPRLEPPASRPRDGPYREPFVSGKPIAPMSRRALIARAMDHAETALLPWPEPAAVVQVVVNSMKGPIVGKHIHSLIVDEIARWPAQRKGRK